MQVIVESLLRKFCRENVFVESMMCKTVINLSKKALKCLKLHLLNADYVIYVKLITVIDYHALRCLIYHARFRIFFKIKNNSINVLNFAECIKVTDRIIYKTVKIFHFLFLIINVLFVVFTENFHYKLCLTSLNLFRCFFTILHTCLVNFNSLLWLQSWLSCRLF